MQLGEMCVKEQFANPPADEGGYDPHFYIRRGVDIGFLLRNIGKVAEQAGYDLDFNPRDMKKRQ